MKNVMISMLAGLSLLSVVFAQPTVKETVKSANLKNEWKLNVPAEQGKPASCYGTLRVDKNDTIWMIVNSDWEKDIVYQITADGKIRHSVIIPADSIYNVNTFESDGNGFLYIGGSWKKDAIRAMAMVKMDARSGEVVWSKKIRGADASMAPMVSSSVITEDGRIIFCSKDDTHPGIRLNVYNPEGTLLLDSIYAFHHDKCIPRNAYISDGKLFVTGQTFGNEGFLLCLDLSNYGIVWKRLSADLCNASEIVRVDAGKVVTSGSSDMLGTTGLAAYDIDGNPVKQASTQRFITGFALEKSGDFWLAGGGVGVNPFAEYYSYPMVSIFSKDIEYVGAHTETDWKGDTYIVASAVLSDGSYLAAMSMEVEPREIHLCKYKVEAKDKNTQTITWNQKIDTMYHKETLKLEASASSNLDVSFFTSDGYREVYVENNTLKVAPSFEESTPNGYKFEIYAVQHGNTDYMPAEYVMKKIMVLVGEREQTAVEDAVDMPKALRYDMSRNTVMINNQANNSDFRLCDLSGRTLLHKQIGEGNQEIRLGSYPAGIYILRLNNSQTTEVLKICIR